MSAHFRQSMSWLHTWAGLLPGWLLFVIFLFGTTAYFQDEISRWMRPELRGGAPTAQAFDAAQAYLTRNAPDAERWTISLPSDRDAKPFRLSWTPRPGSGERGSVILDSRTGREIAVRDTSGGFFLYRFHFELHFLPVKWARLIVWSAALAMLVAILSGIVTHKKIFADFFLLRFGKGQRSWLDVHNMTAVLALPFHLMITYTGLCTLLFTLMPWAISANFPSERAFTESIYPTAPKMEAEGRPGPLRPLSQLVAVATAAAKGAAPSYIVISDPGDAAAVMRAAPRHDRLGSVRDSIFVSAATGEILQPPNDPGPAVATQTVLIDLHTGLFSGPMLRWLYFLSGVGGTVMVASGLVLWTVKRRAKLPDPARPHFGFRLVERLNIGFIVGAPAGIAVYFLANRLLPLGMANRSDWEINSLFIAWGGLFVWSLARPAKRAWVEALAACAALYALVPIANALATERGLIPSLVARDWVFASFDLVMLATAAAFGLAGWKVAAHQPKTVSRRKAGLAEAAA